MTKRMYTKRKTYPASEQVKIQIKRGDTVDGGAGRGGSEESDR